MIRNRILIKSFAAFFIVEMVINTLVPAISWALTAGPTAPEATSFEPVDTTDVVDLKTGDFVYNVPLLEVPGPAGGYPLSLSYHAGIQPDQEASWTGLGFTLNPGSISRLVNGYPDDHEAVNNVDRSYWKGGERTTKTIGISVGVANVATVSAGLSFAQDTYKGRGVGGYVGFGVGYQFSKYLSLGLHSTFGVSPYGDPYSSAGISLGVSAGSQEAMNISGSIGLAFNSGSAVSVNASTGVGVGRTSLLGASISSDGSKPSLSVGGGTSGVYNSKSNHVSVNSNSFQIDIPIYYELSIRLGRDYQRYWIDETASVHTYGSLYLGNVTPNKDVAFDTYDLLDTSIDIVDFSDEEKVLGGSFPDVDSYMVTAQGVSGSIKPYHFQKHLFRQDKYDESGHFITRSYPLSSELNVKPVEFRFVNDFSNRFEYTPGDIHPEFDSNMPSDKEVSYVFDFDGAITTGKNGNEGYNQGNNHLAGSKHVEWYTNSEILISNPNNGPYAEGFVNCKAEGFQRESNTQIGGYSITNASGVTYHYALPAYSYEEYMKTVNSTTKQATDGLRFNLLKKPTKYAYTWFLTAVTGPDFVDRNKNGLADHDDWGYWVNFEYKKWLSDYKWRNPGEGTNKDIDGDFEFFSAGKKEIYYLDKIVTQTHIALFEKSERLDGREVADLISGGFEPTPYIATPGAQTCRQLCTADCDDGGNCDPSCNQCNGLPDDEIAYNTPRSSLKLDNIKLYTYDSYLHGLIGEDNVLRKIEFGYDDYSLAKGTPNSYEEGKPTIKKGKLTLKTLSFLGKKGVSLIPPMTFDYHKNLDYGKDNGEVKVDLWGYYKNDFSTDFSNQTNSIIGKLTSTQSAQDVDTWSLNEIKTSTGATIIIDYESDQYDDVVLAKQQFLRTKEVTDYATDKLKLTFYEQVDLSTYFKVGKDIEIDLVGSFYSKFHSRYVCTGDCDQTTPYSYIPFSFTGNVTVDEINTQDGFIIVSGHDFYNKLKNEPKVDSNGMTVDGYEWHYQFYFEDDQAWPDYFPAGIVSMSEMPKYGGGIRVKSVGIQNTMGNSRLTTYIYENGKTTYEPYQILAPQILPAYKLIVNPIATQNFYKKFILGKFYRQIGISRQLPGPGVLYQNVTVKESNITPDGIAHELPNYTKYEFEMFKEGMVDVVYSDVRTDDYLYLKGNYDNISFKNAYLNKVTLKDFSARVGDLKSITLFNTEDNTQISTTRNNYLYDGLDGTFEDNISKYETDLSAKFLNQGRIEETFSRARIIKNQKFDRNPYPGYWTDKPYFTVDETSVLGTISKMENFPSVQTGQTNTNYQTGITSTSENLAFDFYSGDVTQALTKDSYGNKYLSLSVPAYQNYSGMGLKTTNKSNRNMLTQMAEQYSYVVDANNVPTGVLSASIQTWSDQVPVLNSNAPQTNIWRALASYQWNGQQDLNGDGSYPYDNGSDPSQDFKNHQFTYWNNSTPSIFWQKTGELTLYDGYSHGLEAKDINENYASTKMNNDQSKVIANTTNARYSEIAYSGAEYYIGNTTKDGDVARGSGNPSPAHAHTGQYSLLVGSGNNGFNFTLTPTNADNNKKYRASTWVYLPGQAETQTDLDKLELYYSINGQEAKVSPVLQKNKSKSWYLLNLDIIPDGTSPIYIGVRNNTQRGVYFDDFRVHPLNASLTSYVYDPFSEELTFILDANNFYTKFEYDAMGRLVRTSKELLNFDFGDGKESYRADVILKETKYNYGNSH